MEVTENAAYSLTDVFNIQGVVSPTSYHDNKHHPTPSNAVPMQDLDLRNRIVMAPLTRMRADNADRAPTELHARYYEQRASAGLIIGECTAISPAAYGWADTPGLWSAEQGGGRGGVGA